MQLPNKTNVSDVHQSVKHMLAKLHTMAAVSQRSLEVRGKIFSPVDFPVY